MLLPERIEPSIFDSRRRGATVGDGAPYGGRDNGLREGEGRGCSLKPESAGTPVPGLVGYGNSVV
jgi:hypothetical protein